MINLALDENNDIYVTNYGLARVDGREQIAQRIKTRLQLFFGEWFLDRSAGIPWIEQILIKNPRASVVQGVLKQTILRTPGVIELVEFSITDSDINRAVVVSFAVKTADGTVSDQIEVA